MVLKEFRYLLVLERERSLSKAAEALFTSQPALTHFLQSMEDQLGFTIFERTSQGIRPTKQGQRYLELISEILAHYDSKFSALLANDPDCPTVRLGIADQRASVVFPHIVSCSKARENKINIRLTDTYNGRQELITALERGEEDVVCMVFYGAEEKALKQFHCFKLCGEELLLAIPRGHHRFEEMCKRQKENRRVSWEELRGETFVLCSSRRSLGKYGEQLFQQNGIAPPVAHTSNNMTTLFRTSRSSGCLTLVTEGYIHNNDNEKDFCYASLGEKGVYWSHIALTAEPPTALLVSFAETLREAYRDSLYFPNPMNN